jgi:hypothetical protein
MFIQSFHFHPYRVGHDHRHAMSPGLFGFLRPRTLFILLTCTVSLSAIATFSSCSTYLHTNAVFRRAVVLMGEAFAARHLKCSAPSHSNAQNEFLWNVRLASPYLGV